MSDNSSSSEIDWQSRRIEVKQVEPLPHRVRLISGRFRNWRRFSTWPLLTFFFLTPWLSWNGEPAVYFNLVQKEFHLWNWVLWPEDLTVITGLLVGGAFALFFVSMYAGRLWCGYACPQTTWTFMFLWIEEKLEGKRQLRLKVDKGKGTRSQKIRRGIKFVIWALLSLATAVTALAYFYPLEIWLADLLQGDISGAASAWVIIIGGLTFVNAGWLREKFCTDACPYSRFQSVMFDSYTQTVRYDEKRGEPRGKRKPDSTTGDCINCNWCVDVCPTNIDIRDGLQIACVDCGACIDACDQVMLKVGKPTGLITYKPEQQRSTGQRWRLWGYGLAVCVTAVLTLFSTLNNEALTASVQRDRLSLYQLTPNDTVTNRYHLSLHNRTTERLLVAIQDGKITLATIEIPSGGRAGQTINIEREMDEPSGKVDIRLVYGGETQTLQVSYSNPYANRLAAN